MQTTTDRDKGSGASPNATDGRTGEQRTGGSPTELARHYGEHGHPATTAAGPSPQDAAHDSSQGGGQSGATQSSATTAGATLSGATETARDMANRAAEQARSAMAKAGETAQDLASRAREQAAPAAQAVYDQGARAGEYVASNVHQYPTTALLIAAAVGYGLAYLIHGSGGSRREDRRLYGRTN
jgi:ElaB/YqjD/DUF883 family membrane-anchored ribosome-binding protein